LWVESADIGEAWHGGAWRGAAGHGEAGQGKEFKGKEKMMIQCPICGNQMVKIHDWYQEDGKKFNDWICRSCDWNLCLPANVVKVIWEKVK